MHPCQTVLNFPHDADKWSISQSSMSLQGKIVLAWIILKSRYTVYAEFYFQSINKVWPIYGSQTPYNSSKTSGSLPQMSSIKLFSTLLNSQGY